MFLGWVIGHVYVWMLLACIRKLEVCIRIQMACVCTPIRKPFVYVRILVPKNPNLSFLLLFLYFFHITCLCFDFLLCF